MSENFVKIYEKKTLKIFIFGLEETSQGQSHEEMARFFEFSSQLNLRKEAVNSSTGNKNYYFTLLRNS